MKNFKRFLVFAVFVTIFFLVINLIPPKKVIHKNPFIRGSDNKPLVAAHRGGKQLNPENTLKAFDYAVNQLHVDILEFDLVTTKDQKLVAIHNLTINECSDVEMVTGKEGPHYVSDYTLEELENFNFGYHFKSRNGQMPYKELVAKDQIDRKAVIQDHQVNIVTIDKIFDLFYHLPVKFIVEIKDEGEIGEDAADYLYQLMTANEKYKDFSLIERVILGSFHKNVEEYVKETYPSIMRGASTKSATGFLATQMMGVNLFNTASFVALQIPIQQKVGTVTIHLDRKTYINRAHKRNISIQYWTINEKKKMKELISLGVDVIITDAPDYLIEVIHEMGLA